MISANILMAIFAVCLTVWGLWKLKQDFNERTFFKIGMWLFIIQGASNTYGLILEYGGSPFWSVVSRTGSILFNFLIAYFFYYMMNKTPASMGGPGTELSPSEIEKFITGEYKEK